MNRLTIAAIGLMLLVAGCDVSGNAPKTEKKNGVADIVQGAKDAEAARIAAEEERKRKNAERYAEREKERLERERKVKESEDFAWCFRRGYIWNIKKEPPRCENRSGEVIVPDGPW